MVGGKMSKEDKNKITAMYGEVSREVEEMHEKLNRRDN
jgi:hypothetical protein